MYFLSICLYDASFLSICLYDTDISLGLYVSMTGTSACFNKTKWRGNYAEMSIFYETRPFLRIEIIFMRLGPLFF
jgi:hypothetical protein